MMVDDREYPFAVGKIIANLLSLEFVLRVSLSDDDPPHERLPPERNIPMLREGEVVPCGSLTNYDTLGELIKKYNKNIEVFDPDLRVDPEIVIIRDALAHGRVLSLEPNGDLTLVKFDRPRNGQVMVTFAQPLSNDWMADQVSRVHQEVLKVMLSIERQRIRNAVRG